MCMMTCVFNLFCLEAKKMKLGPKMLSSLSMRRPWRSSGRRIGMQRISEALNLLVPGKDA